MTQENHQDYICMTMITARAAVLAAVFFIFNLGHHLAGGTMSQEKTPHAIDHTKFHSTSRRASSLPRPGRRPSG